MSEAIETERQRREVLTETGGPERFGKRVLFRACLQMPDGSYRAPKDFSEEHTVLALQIVRRDIKRAVHGLGPLFGQELLLEIAADVLREDFDADSPQTVIDDPED